MAADKPLRWDRMTREEQREASAEKARQECAEQGIPFELSPDVAEQVARVVAGARRDRDVA